MHLALLISTLAALFGLGLGQPAWSAETVRVGVASMITPVSAVRYYQDVVDYLGRKLGRPTEMIHRSPYDEIDTMLERGELEVAFICTSPYVLNHEKFGVELLVAPQVDGEVFYHSNLIVHKDSPLTSLLELRGEEFAFVDPKSNSGRLYTTYMLARKQEVPESFFSSYLYSYSHNKSVELVAKKRVAAAAVDSIVYDFMVATDSPYAAETRVIHRSPPFGMPPVVVPPGTPLLLKKELRSIFTSMHSDPEGREILTAMRIERFVEVPDSNYDPVRGMRAFIHNNRIEATTAIGGVKQQQAEESRKIFFGILPRDNPIIAYERYQPLADYLSMVTGLPIELQMENSYQGVVNSLGSGRSDFALLGALTYLDAAKRYGAVPIARSKTVRGETFFRSVIVTDLDMSIRELDQLVDRRFAFAALWSTSGNLVPRYMLAWAGIHLDQLTTYHHYNYHDTVAKKVIAGEFDAGALRLSTAERYLSHGLKIIATSDPIPTGPVVVSPRTPAPLVEKIRTALLEMTTSEAGRVVLNKLDPDLQGGFVATSDSDYAGIRRMINEVPMTCGKGCHPPLTF